MNRRIVQRLLISSVVTMAIIGCQVVAGIERVDKVAAGSAGTDSGANGEGGPGKEDTGVPSNDPCKHAFPADPPAKDDDPGTELPAFYLALKTITVTNPQGFDLDNVCTCDSRPNTAQGGRSSCTPKQKNKDCDGDGGTDNSGATLFSALPFQPGNSLDDQITNDLTEGRQGLLLYIQGWNGKPNDLDVHVGVVVSQGVKDPTGCGGTPTGKNHYPPQWCGQDRWTYQTGAIDPGNTPHFLAPAYVSGNQLVFRSPGKATLFFGNATLGFNAPIMAGTLAKSGSGYTLVGALAGRIESSDLLAAAGQFTDPENRGDPDTGAGRKYICENTIVYSVISSTICGGRDIIRDPKLDFQDIACDSVSTSIGFTAEPAVLGAEEPAPGANDNPCTPANHGAYTCP